jgi:hypothetical protein
MVNAKYFTNFFSKSAFDLDPSPTYGLNVGDISERAFHYLPSDSLIINYKKIYDLFALENLKILKKKCSKSPNPKIFFRIF